MKLTKTQMFALKGVLMATTQAQEMLKVAQADLKDLVIEFGLDPAKQYQFSPDGEVVEVAGSTTEK